MLRVVDHVLYLSGDLNFANAGSRLADITRLILADEINCIDVADVKQFDSAGIAVLLAAIRCAEQSAKHIALQSPTEAILQMISLNDLHQIIRFDRC